MAVAFPNPGSLSIKYSALVIFCACARFAKSKISVRGNSFLNMHFTSNIKAMYRDQVVGQLAELNIPNVSVLEVGRVYEF